jgi:hypothetical protein
MPGLQAKTLSEFYPWPEFYPEFYPWPVLSCTRTGSRALFMSSRTEYETSDNWPWIDLKGYGMLGTRPDQST